MEIKENEIDIFKDMEELRHADERSREFPKMLNFDLLELAKKYNLEEFTKVPNYIIVSSLMQHLNTMRYAFMKYLIHVNQQIYMSRGETLTSIEPEKEEEECSTKTAIKRKKHS